MTPGSPHANELLGWTLVSSGRIDEGIRSLEHAYELDPLSDFMLYNFAGSLLFVGEGKRALDLLRPALARSSGNGVLHQLLGVGLMVTDRLPEARAALKRARELTLSLRLPESLHRKVRELAEREDISINQFIATAVAELRAAMTPNGRCTSQGRFGSSGSAAAFDECPCRMLAGEDCTVGGV